MVYSKVNKKFWNLEPELKLKKEFDTEKKPDNTESRFVKDPRIWDPRKIGEKCRKVGIL